MKRITAIYLDKDDVLDSHSTYPMLKPEAEKAAQNADITIYKRRMIRNNIDISVEIRPSPSMRRIKSEVLSALIMAVQSDSIEEQVQEIINDNITERQKDMLDW